MKKLPAILGTLAVLAVAALAVIYSGLYPISILQHDCAVMNWAMQTGMIHSVRYHARGIAAPNLSDPAMAREGFGHYQEMCVSCHGAPGVDPDEIAQGLWPKAPDLAKSARHWSPSELFWITKNGVKFTAMPAWGPSHGDDKIWAIVAFLKTLPRLSPSQYKVLKSASPSRRE
ncbi:MAG TPA: cytochrome c [Bryobacteraceae bacterium]|nr:cytochrome c [Bryobacteraceae bacterium]